ncbi:MAG: bifunctional phosphoribosylaminoimidazolecarboxamide formyltransferase/IMP cyclohydrolase [Candidatus Freyarchaeota archaeon]|nr:bifunctional phosphoribosylaminoimidazolecarboxamide formyltransferase/IMP cyclohydrolase [Candidatus Freyrarchaeum guaymaensis]
MKVKRALISVWDKKGVYEFAAALHEMGVEIIATDGTAKALKGLPVKRVSELTGFAELLDGRVKSLHPYIYSAVLARDRKDHLEQLEKLGVKPIDLVAVNLYPFKEAAVREGLEKLVDYIDIGGPSLVRAAAKNFERVTVVVDPKDYKIVIDELKQHGEVKEETRRRLAVKAFAYTSEYDDFIAYTLSKRFFEEEVLPEFLTLKFVKVQNLRYGENPHQVAALYREAYPSEDATVVDAEQLHGRELSFNNMLDLNAAIEIVREFTSPMAVVIKHTNPCGAAIGETIREAYVKARESDPLSAYGSIVGLNREADLEVAKEITSTFVEAVVAPGYTPAALNELRRKENLRVLRLPRLNPRSAGIDFRRVTGGLLVQTEDVVDEQVEGFKVVSLRKPTEKELQAALFGWKIVKHVKSNAIVVSTPDWIVGVGAGQMSRVDSAKLALEKAGDRAKGGALASDGFIPFRDTVDAAAEAGITCIIQPGGSKRDQEVTEAANEYDMVMIHTGKRHFKH